MGLMNHFCFAFWPQGGALLGNVNALHTSFPDDPGEQYRSQCEVVLEGLGLTHILNKELRRLSG